MPTEMDVGVSVVSTISILSGSEEWGVRQSMRDKHKSPPVPTQAPSMVRQAIRHIGFGPSHWKQPKLSD